jgi:hypothetical protein
MKLYSNKRRVMDARTGRSRPTIRGPRGRNRQKPALQQSSSSRPPDPKSARALRPLWRDLIQKIWGEDLPVLQGQHEDRRNHDPAG